MKRTITIIVAFLFWSVSQHAFAQPCPPELLPLTPAIVKIWCGHNGGSGTLIWARGSEGYVVTCKHVVEGYRQATCEFRSGYKCTGPVMGLGTSYDTAVIKIVPPADATVIPLAVDPPPQGVEVHAFGYGGQYGVPIQQIQLIHWSSKLYGYKVYGDNVSLLKIDAYAKSGDSGGPIVYNGTVVGLVAGGQLAYKGGPPVDTHGPYCTPIRNLLRGIAPHALVKGIDAVREERQQIQHGYG